MKFTSVLIKEEAPRRFPYRSIGKNLVVFILCLFCQAARSQVEPSSGGVIDLKYRRSSLYTLMLDDSSRQFADAIRAGYNRYVISEKFNNHNLDTRMITSVAGEADKKPFIDIFIKNNHIARKMVAKWFNRSPKGGFSMDTIAARGSYSASDIDVKVARTKKRGNAILQDAGVELINKTFLIVSDFEYTTWEEYMSKFGKAIEAVEDVGQRLGLGGGLGVLSSTQKSVSDATTGYVVYSTTYLYQLEWNDSIEAVMYEQYWTEDAKIDPARVKAFDDSDIFRLNYIGKETKEVMVPQFTAAQKSQEELIGIATRRAVDKAIAHLQKKYDDFRTKTPLYSVEPLTAKIGLKEDVKGNDEYAVIQQYQDEDGRTYYKQIGTIRVDGKQIWDNRYDVADEEKQSSVTATSFKGGKSKYYPGLMIIQGSSFKDKRPKTSSSSVGNDSTNK